ncbi:hypothetical protein [Brevifollis gellanilyticus]|nr:hypothetical protein [Brevifollis gellanilyticus]
MKKLYHRLLVVPVFMLALFCTQCSSDRVWSRAEFEAWYAESLPNYSNLERVRYRGSDAHDHYFLLRPVDSFVTARIPRAEITIKEERPYAGGSSSTLGYYDVDVLHGYARTSDE